MTKKVKESLPNHKDWVPTKPRKKRKPLTPEQRSAAIERLALARAARKPAVNSSVHSSLLGLPEDHFLHPSKVKSWIKTQKSILNEEKSSVRKGVSGAIAKVADIEGYIRHCNAYLKTGDWCDDRYGEHQEGRVKWKTITPKGPVVTKK